MIEVTEEKDGTITISWDENDPVESIMNTWTKQDFIDAIMRQCDTLSSDSSDLT